MMPKIESLLSPRQCAPLLGVSYERVIQLINAGKLRATRIGVSYVVDPKDVEKLEGRQTKPGRPKGSKNKPK